MSEREAGTGAKNRFEGSVVMTSRSRNDLLPFRNSALTSSRSSTRLAVVAKSHGGSNIASDQDRIEAFEGSFAGSSGGRGDGREGREGRGIALWFNDCLRLYDCGREKGCCLFDFCCCR